jgi:hypothetical protein
MSSILRDSLDYGQSTGDSTRVKECDSCIGQGNSLAVQITRKEDGFLWYCFRCSKAGFFPDKGASPKQVQEIVANAGKDKTKINRPQQVELPHDFTELLPPKALVQLYNLRLTDEDIERHEIGWSKSHDRIIIPVFKWGKGPAGWAKKLVGVMGRKLDGEDNGDKPKWWSQRNESVKHPRFVALAQSSTFRKEVVIVEDIFSAIRISNQGVMSMALLTTYLPYELYPHLRGWTVKIWLDADAYDKAVKYQAALGAHGVTATTIYTDLDPKAYNESDIQKAIAAGGL